MLRKQKVGIRTPHDRLYWVFHLYAGTCPGYRQFVRLPIPPLSPRRSIYKSGYFRNCNIALCPGHRNPTGEKVFVPKLACSAVSVAAIVFIIMGQWDSYTP